MEHKITINNFTLSFFDDGYPLLTTIEFEGKEIARVRHDQLVDLEYALQRIRARAQACLPADYKHEANG